MLFDLRSRNRRATVKVIYLFLAVVMVVGLVGLGIGTGNTGGLLNAGGNGSGGSGSTVNTAQIKAAINAVKKSPSAANWSRLLSVYYETASGSSNSSTGAYTATGKAYLRKAGDAWQHYLTATGNNPSLNNSMLAARLYQTLGQWSSETNAWNYAAQSEAPSQRLTAYYCLALSSYAAKQTAKGDLAAARAVALYPKSQRLAQKQALQSAKSSPTTAQTALVQSC